MRPPTRALFRLIRNARGVTLAELMVAMVILTVGVVGAMSSFTYITRAISASRLKTIATNLAQEKMETLKNLTYFQLLVTTNTTLSTGYSPNFSYDTAQYPPENITLWGLPALTRSVNIDYASVSGTDISTVPFTSNDTGMKKITVYVFWTERGVPRKVKIDSYLENPSVATLSTGFKGSVLDTHGHAVVSANVQVLGIPKWHALADSAGNFTFQVAPGSYTLVASSNGFHSQSTNQLSVTEGAYTTNNFTLSEIATGTVSSDSVYALNTSGLLISQVVASTITPNGWDAQFVELYNPTTSQINISGGVNNLGYQSHSVYFYYYKLGGGNGGDQWCYDWDLTYVSSYVAAGRYYLVANTNTFVLGGANVTADAYFRDTAGNSCHLPNPTPVTDWWNPPGMKKIIQDGEDGSVYVWGGGLNYDYVGWKNDSQFPPWYQGTPIPLSAGLVRGDQIVRFSTPCVESASYARVYNTNDNGNNFVYDDGSAPGVNYPPFSSASAPPPKLSGVISPSGYVFSNDGTSAAGTLSSPHASGPQGQSCAYSSFTLVGVATGSWIVSVIGSNFSADVSGVSVSQGVTTAIGNATTSPTWPVANYNAVVLTSTYTGGFATGYVYGSGVNYWTHIGSILVASADGSATTRTDSNGFYTLALATGTETVIANFNADNGNYTTETSPAFTVTQGNTVSASSFHLTQGAYLRGYVTSGTGALPNIVVHAALGSAVFSDTSDNTGYFSIFASTSSSAYTVTPDLDSLQTYSFTQSNAAVITTAGTTVFVGTYTIVGAMGTIAGSVKNGGKTITTGVLVIASTSTVSTSPPAIYASTAPAYAVTYAGSSEADGTYSLEVRSSTTSTYNVRAFYPVVDPVTGATSYSSKLLSGISVNAGATTNGNNFTWP